MRGVVLPSISAAAEWVHAIATAEIAAITTADIRIAIEVVIAIDVDVAAAPTTTPAPTTAPKESHRDSDTK